LVRATELRRRLRQLKSEALRAPPMPSLEGVLRSGSTVQLIAEIKRRSPSKGPIDESMDAADRAAEYVTAGATAISVLTERDSFGGSNDDLVAVRNLGLVPVLKKDFHVDPAQVWEARALGASALLLIVRALGPDGTYRMRDVAGEAELEALFEVRDEQELDWALEAGGAMIGVNRRDLETLILDDDVPARIVPRIPSDCVAIAESGITSREGVEAVARVGADAVLVGSSLSAASRAGEAVQNLTGVQKQKRNG
jgi:indole-3-glycerol phosphate synthase